MRSSAAQDSGAEVTVIDMKGMTACRVCGDGRGTCGSENECAFADDGFAAAQEAAREADAIVLVTPVYWAEVAEGLKSFMIGSAAVRAALDL